MSSFKSKLIYFFMKNRNLFQFKLKKEKWDFNTSITDFRIMCEKSNSILGKLPSDVVVSPLTINGITAEWIVPDGVTKDKVILYTVGGGYVSGSCNDHRSLVAKLSKSCGTSVLLFNHSLAPEDPFPAALDDTLSVYSWLLSTGIAPQNMMIVGESAGGGLCLATLNALRDKGIALPCAAVAISPWTDLKLTGESHRTKAKVCLSPEGMAEVCSKYYIGDNDPCNPWISPLYGDLHGLPPILIYVGEYETMLDDSVLYAKKAKESGVDIKLVIGKKMIHCYPLLAPLFKEATQAMDDICSFINRSLNK